VALHGFRVQVQAQVTGLIVSPRNHAVDVLTGVQDVGDWFDTTNPPGVGTNATGSMEVACGMSSGNTVIVSASCYGIYSNGSGPYDYSLFIGSSQTTGHNFCSGTTGNTQFSGQATLIGPPASGTTFPYVQQVMIAGSTNRGGSWGSVLTLTWPSATAVPTMDVN
jgi:hypothetical protein